MRASKGEIVNAACNVAEALNALEASENANDDTTKRYRDHLGSCIYRLKFLIERDNRPITKRLRSQAAHSAAMAIANGPAGNPAHLSCTSDKCFVGGDCPVA